MLRVSQQVVIGCSQQFVDTVVEMTGRLQ